MHEFGLCESFMDAVLRRAAGREVNGVRLRIGALHRVEPESLRQAFAFISMGTVAEGAIVELITVPAGLACEACGVNIEAAELLAACPDCGGVDLRIVAGNELVLESIRLAKRGGIAGSTAGGEPVEESVLPVPRDGHTYDQDDGGRARPGRQPDSDAVATGGV